MDKRASTRLSLDLLRGFRMAARHLSFTRAAQELFITQSAISREIKTLEEQIGKPLFRRVHRALQLTHAGEELYRARDDALSLLDAAAQRIAESGQTVAVTTTTALASLWLAPKLPGFNRLYPDISVRMVASNDKLDLEREQLDIGIRIVLKGSDIPNGERLIDSDIFPVCSPTLVNNVARPLKCPADLANHVRLEVERMLDGRPWSEWDVWFGAMKIAAVKPVSTQRFSQYDHVIPAAIDGAGIAMGARPHLARHLAAGMLCAPFGSDLAANLGSFYIVTRPKPIASDATQAFVAWLRSEVKRDSELTLARPRQARQRTVPSTHSSRPRKRVSRS